MKKGTLYLLPSPLGESSVPGLLPSTIPALFADVKNIICESEKNARRTIRYTGYTGDLNTFRFSLLNEHTRPDELHALLEPLLKGENVCLMSDAGMPVLADPGSPLVRLAHIHGVRVIPVPGPSSILLALAASGLNGQNFCFHGYLPKEMVDRYRLIREIEKEARKGCTQIFIETPYRNDKLTEELLQLLSGDTLLCLACDLTLATEWIRTASVSEWKKERSLPGKRPCVFLAGK